MARASVRMRMQFSLKRLFLAITLVAVGGAIAWPPFKAGNDVVGGLPELLWQLGGMLIGAGIGQLYKRHWLVAL